MICCLIISDTHAQQLLLLLLECSILALNLTHSFCHRLLPNLSHLLPFDPFNFRLEFVPLPLFLFCCFLFSKFKNLLFFSLKFDDFFLKMCLPLGIDSFCLSKFFLMHLFYQFYSIIVFDLFMGEL